MKIIIYSNIIYIIVELKSFYRLSAFCVLDQLQKKNGDKLKEISYTADVMCTTYVTRCWDYPFISIHYVSVML